MSRNGMNRSYDLIVWGATGFTGRLVCEYLAHSRADQPELRWAMAGRSQARLEALREELGEEARDIELITADSHDRASLDRMTASASVILTTVGPYALHGSELVASCASNGTDYCDLAGEVPWMRRMIDRHEDEARQSGARIVHCCGFDSIPSDLGVHFLQGQARTRFGKPLERIHFRLKAAKGSFSGGTVASMLNIMDEARADRDIHRLLRNPYALCPDPEAERPRQAETGGAAHDEDLDVWLAPFVMAGINTRVVHRSNALSDYGYGQDFRYDEAVITGRGTAGRLKALGLSAGLKSFMMTAALRPGRALMQRLFLPDPGEGPGAAEREAGFFNIIFHGREAGGKTLRARVTGDRDPGYGATSRMISEAALALVASREEPPTAGGFWTPATALGNALLERLSRHAGLSFRLDESD